ncbi:MAG: DUF502 domain-containing protein [Proteobacteria bacterium]|nr:DUF502 domain-containing protein [Pseudomonadota bacterium]MDA1131995.1 DUF502 domain-containing protein [Pseudomonadota bacterium]
MSDQSDSPDGPKKPWERQGGFARRLRNHFFTGIIVTAPIAITIFLVWQFIGFVDGTIAGLIPARYLPQTYLPFAVPGIGLLIAFVFLTLVGALAANFLGRWLVRTGDRIVNRMPVVRSVYGTLKKIFETVLAQSSRSFREVVLVEYPRKGIWAVGFITGTTEGEIQTITTSKMINVFLPTTPNPTSGFLLFVPHDTVVPLQMSVEEGIKLVISGGIMVPPEQGAPHADPRVVAQPKALAE